MINHSHGSIIEFPLEDEDREFKDIIESHIDFQRSSYPQPLSSLAITQEIITKKKKKTSQTKRTTTTTLPPNYMKLEGRTRFSNISKLPQLRILKRDIRRRYLEMYSNVLNSHDINLYSRFLHEFCTPNCQSLVLVPSLQVPIVINGIQEILRDGFTNQAMLPDGIVRSSGDAKIYVPLETSGSRIVASVTFRGTKLFDILPDDEEEVFINNDSFSSSSSSSISSNDFDDTDSSKSEDTESHDTSENYPQTKRSISSLLPSFKSLRLSPSSTPMELNLSAEFTIHLDASNRIERFVVNTVSISSSNVSVYNETSHQVSANAPG